MRAEAFSLTCFALLQFATAQAHQPFWRRASHQHHPKRADPSCAADAAIVTTTATAVETVTYQFQDIIVYVNDSNKAVSSTTIYRNLVSSSAAPAPVSSPIAPPSSPSQPAPSSPPPPPSTSSSATPPPIATPKKPEPGGPDTHAAAPPAPSSSPPPSSNAGASSSSGPGFGSAISYTPYNGDNSCKSAQQVAQDLQPQASSYEVIRLYGTDCNQVANVIAATKGNVKLFLGIFDIDSIQSEVQTISSAVKGNWALVNTINVGNELVNSGKASAGQVTSAISTARSALKAAGYSGPVVTVDTMVAMKNNPSLCTSSDFCAINCHAFFDGNVLPEGAGDFVKQWAEQVSQAAGGGKTVVVSESGWPTQGGTNGKAVASQQAHEAAIESLKAAFGGGRDLVLYGMYNEGWKKDSASTFGAEKYWGLYGNAPS